MPIAILCSGQGQQHAGMFDLVADAPEAAEFFIVAAELLDGQDPRELVRSASPEALEDNRTAQILCVLQAVAFQAALGDALPQHRLVAGYSVGEVAAWALAGLISGKQALQLVAIRAEAMNAASRGREGLTFVRGLKREAIERLCRSQETALAIANPGDGFVVGGTVAALQTFEEEAVRSGAERIVRLKVHVASHTPRLANASAAFASSLAISAISEVPSGVRLFSGIDGASVIDVSSGAIKLADQISHTVEWASCLESCKEAGASAFLELGPGHALSDMATEVDPRTRSRCAEDFKGLSGIRDWIVRQAQQ
ncbi:acyltransferase domain-containing protein [Agrobacterium cavarae]